MPQLANEHVDTFLTNISVAYTNEGYVADMVFPVLPVDKRSDKYVIYNKDSFLRSSGKDGQGKPGSIRRPGDRSTKIQFDVSNNSYYCEQLARHYPLTDEEVAYADSPIMPEISATESLTDTIMLDHEIAVAGKVGLRSNYNSSNKAQLTTGGTGTSWASGSSTNSNPISVDIPNGKKAVISGLVRAANQLLVNYNTAVTLSQHPQYLDKIKYTSREGLTAGGLAPVIEGLQVVEARAQYATSSEGAATVTTGMVWVDDQSQDIALIYYKNPQGAATLRSVQFGVTFEAPDSTLDGRGFLIKKWREEWVDSTFIECRTTRDWRFICTDGSTNGDNASGYATGAYLLSGTTL